MVPNAGNGLGATDGGPGNNDGKFTERSAVEYDVPRGFRARKPEEVFEDENSATRLILNKSLPLYGGDVARPSNWRAHEHDVQHLESNARKCDMHATPRMSHAHGTYVPPSVAVVADCTYVACNNNKKRETPWSRRAQQGR